MFALREIGNTEAVLALAKGLKDKSALFRHEGNNNKKKKEKELCYSFYV